jgi:hypothetical protein
MKALVWHCKEDILYVTVSQPKIRRPGDVVRILSYVGFMPTMEMGDILEHESMAIYATVNLNVKKHEL